MGSDFELEHPTIYVRDVIWGVIFALIGVGGFTTIDISWPIIFIVIGVAMLVKTFFRRE